jgi:uncharacterized protein YeaO (DUF488 family)
MKIQIKRIYEPRNESDGMRILVDRLWPRGVKKGNAQIDEWLKDIAPTTQLRKWFNHDASKWQEFQLKYTHELQHNPNTEHLLELLNKHQTITLLYAAHDEAHNHALVLQHFIRQQLKK